MSSCKTLTCVTDEEIKPTKLFYHLCPSDLPASPLQDNKQCGVYSGFEGHWQSLSCESALPYICKKTPNDTRGAEPLGENMQETQTYWRPLCILGGICAVPSHIWTPKIQFVWVVRVRPAAVQLDSGTWLYPCPDMDLRCFHSHSCICKYCFFK